jgi:hypothetical protein
LDDEDLCEYAILVEGSAVPRAEPGWNPKWGLPAAELVEPTRYDQSTALAIAGEDVGVALGGRIR